MHFVLKSAFFLTFVTKSLGQETFPQGQQQIIPSDTTEGKVAGSTALLESSSTTTSSSDGGRALTTTSGTKTCMEVIQKEFEDLSKTQCKRQCFREGRRCIGVTWDRSSQTCIASIRPKVNDTTSPTSQYCVRTKTISKEHAIRNFGCMKGQHTDSEQPDIKICKDECTEKCKGVMHNEDAGTCTSYGTIKRGGTAFKCDRKPFLSAMITCPCFTQDQIQYAVDSIISGRAYARSQSCVVAGDTPLGLYHGEDDMFVNLEFTVAGKNRQCGNGLHLVDSLVREEVEHCENMVNAACTSVVTADIKICPCFDEGNLREFLALKDKDQLGLATGSCDINEGATSISLYLDGTRGVGYGVGGISDDKSKQATCMNYDQAFSVSQDEASACFSMIQNTCDTILL